MSITTNAAELVKVANSRPDDDAAKALEYEQPVKKLGSRVTKKQVEVISKVLTRGQLTTLHSNKKALTTYADTGDASALTPEQNDALKKVVEAGRANSENDSQKRRIWPRKVAAIVASIESPSS